MYSFCRSIFLLIEDVYNEDPPTLAAGGINMHLSKIIFSLVCMSGKLLSQTVKAVVSIFLKTSSSSTTPTHTFSKSLTYSSEKGFLTIPILIQ